MAIIDSTPDSSPVKPDQNAQFKLLSQNTRNSDVINISSSIESPDTKISQTKKKKRLILLSSDEESSPKGPEKEKKKGFVLKKPRNCIFGGLHNRTTATNTISKLSEALSSTIASDKVLCANTDASNELSRTGVFSSLSNNEEACSDRPTSSQVQSPNVSDTLGGKDTIHTSLGLCTLDRSQRSPRALNKDGGKSPTPFSPKKKLISGKSERHFKTPSTPRPKDLVSEEEDHPISKSGTLLE